MPILPKLIQALIGQLSRLPGIGPKTAARLAFYFASGPKADPASLGKILLALRKGLTICSLCHNIAEKDPCDICSSSSRDRTILCVVEEPLDLLAIEKSKSYRGLYYVLGGRISPAEDRGAEDLKIGELVGRIRQDRGIKEVIIATNPTLEGDATANFLIRTLSPLKIKLTRLGRGLSVGGSLEYTDEVTLAGAFENRKEI